MHAPFRGGLHCPVGQAEGNCANHLVVIEPPGIFLTMHQARLMEGEQQVMGIDEIEGSEGFSSTTCTAGPVADSLTGQPECVPQAVPQAEAVCFGARRPESPLPATY